MDSKDLGEQAAKRVARRTSLLPVATQEHRDEVNKALTDKPTNSQPPWLYGQKRKPKT